MYKEVDVYSTTTDSRKTPAMRNTHDNHQQTKAHVHATTVITTVGEEKSDNWEKHWHLKFNSSVKSRRFYSKQEKSMIMKI